MPRCTATHPDHGPCNRHGYAHERHASDKGTWYTPTTEALPDRLRRLASEPTPATIDSRVVSHYEGYHAGLTDAALIAEAQTGQIDLRQILVLLDRALAGKAGYLSLTLLPDAAGDVGVLLPGAKVEEGVVSAVNGFDVRTCATATIGNLAVKVVHLRPATGDEVKTVVDRRAAKTVKKGGAT